LTDEKESNETSKTNSKKKQRERQCKNADKHQREAWVGKYFIKRSGEKVETLRRLT
jgi:hypothetical protein